MWIPLNRAGMTARIILCAVFMAGSHHVSGAVLIRKMSNAKLRHCSKNVRQQWVKRNDTSDCFNEATIFYQVFTKHNLAQLSSSTPFSPAGDGVSSGCHCFYGLLRIQMIIVDALDTFG